jgi:hypothetical protein
MPPVNKLANQLVHQLPQWISEEQALLLAGFYNKVKSL